MEEANPVDEKIVELRKGECLSKTKRTIAESAIIDMLNGRWRSRGVVTTAHMKAFLDRLCHVHSAYCTSRRVDMLPTELTVIISALRWMHVGKEVWW
jgi:hypothetical protein